jgi:ATP-dependent Clp protease ATP-binding subunit ClpA
MLSRNLEQTLRRALALANARQHEYATLEHLLMALIEDEDATAVLKGCAVEADRLRANLNDFLDHELTSLAVQGVVDAEPAAGFQRVTRRAAVSAQSSGRSEVTGADVLAALFSERESMPSTTSVTASRSTSVTASGNGQGTSVRPLQSWGG